MEHPTARPWETQRPDIPDASDFLIPLRAQLPALETNLPDSIVLQLSRFCATLAFFRARLNLTSLTDPHLIVQELICDSLLALRLGEWLPSSHIIDIGAGSGVPGLPLALARPDWTIELLERKATVAVYLEEAVRTSGAGNATVLSCAWEDYPYRMEGEAKVYTAKAVFPIEHFCRHLTDLARPTDAGLWWGAPDVGPDRLPPPWRIANSVTSDLPAGGRTTAIYLLSRE